MERLRNFQSIVGLLRRSLRPKYSALALMAFALVVYALTDHARVQQLSEQSCRYDPYFFTT